MCGNLTKVFLGESLLDTNISVWAFLAHESEINGVVVEVRYVEDAVGGDQLVVEHLVEIFSFLTAPGDVTAGETWVHGAVEGENGCGGETTLVEVVDAADATATFLSDSCYKLLVERLSDTEGADS